MLQYLTMIPIIRANGVSKYPYRIWYTILPIFIGTAPYSQFYNSKICVKLDIEQFLWKLYVGVKQ